MATEYWAHRYHNDPKLATSEVSDDDLDDDEVDRLMNDPDAWDEIETFGGGAAQDGTT